MVVMAGWVNSPDLRGRRVGCGPRRPRFGSGACRRCHPSPASKREGWLLRSATPTTAADAAWSRAPTRHRPRRRRSGTWWPPGRVPPDPRLRPAPPITRVRRCRLGVAGPPGVEGVTDVPGADWGVGLSLIPTVALTPSRPAGTGPPHRRRRAAPTRTSGGVDPVRGPAGVRGRGGCGAATIGTHGQWLSRPAGRHCGRCGADSSPMGHPARRGSGARAVRRARVPFFSAAGGRWRS